MAHSLRDYHPSITQSQILWKIYEERVAPVVMIHHKPTIGRLIYKASNNYEYLDRTSEATVFAVYFVAVTSMNPSECENHLGETHTSTLHCYRFATQQALARTDFLQTRSLAVLEAAVLFLTCIRRPGDADFGLGLYRDGTHFDLDPFETELRRRLWWSIFLLDVQTSEYHTIPSQIYEANYNTKLPLNINDADLSPESTEAPEERDNFTEMTFCIARCEMTATHCQIFSSGSSLPFEKQLRALEHLHTRPEERYLRFCDVSVPIQWVTATIIRLAMARLWLVAHLPQMSTGELIPGTPGYERLFQTAIEVVEFAYLLEVDERTARWSWLFEAYMQWHAVAFVLSELCTRPQSPETYRAWKVVEQAYLGWKEKDIRQRGGDAKDYYSFAGEGCCCARTAMGHI
ncbi:hypothetical protein BBP40_006909 [Aspergillus hancockii]|nr:hypothetical protein BBP40_006909 [Aspergillus hancockii]